MLRKYFLSMLFLICTFLSISVPLAAQQEQGESTASPGTTMATGSFNRRGNGLKRIVAARFVERARWLRVGSCVTHSISETAT